MLSPLSLARRLFLTQDTMEEKLSTTNFELATCTGAAGFRLVPAAELQPYIAAALAEAAAEAAQ